MKPGVPVDQSAIPVLSSAFGLGGGQATPTMEQLSDVDAVGITNGEVLVWDAASSTWVPSSIVSGSPWFNVMNYGALNDGSTDDTTAINAAIAALNAAGSGVLYFPAGTGYKVTAALTTITATGTILGDGIEASKIMFTHATAVLFTATGGGVTFRGLWLENSASTTNGAAIRITTNGNLNRYEDLLFGAWWVALDIQSGTAWAARGLFIEAANKYGVKVTGTGPDWSIADSYFSAVTTSPDAAIYIAPSTGGDGGGGKIVNTKINGDPATGYVTGIDLAMANGTATSILLVSNCSIENVSGDGIRATMTGTGRYSHITITGCQVGLYSNNGGRAVKLTAATNGVFGANGSLGIVTIDGSVLTTDGTARAAIELTKTDRVTLGDLQLSGFNARYTSSGDTNTTDAVGSGTVTSVALTVPAEFSIAGSPITTSGTLAITSANESANTVWAGPTSGSAAAPSFRALVAADIPAGVGTTDHEHIMNLWFSGDGSTTVFTLPAGAFDSQSVRVWVSGTLTDVTLSGAILDTMTFGSAPASATNNIVVDLVAAVA